MANLPGVMNRRTITAALAFLLLLLAPGTGTAIGSSGKAWFEAKTEGSPVTAMRGSWVVANRSADLTLRGAHAIGDKTTFEAGWVTPVTRKTRKAVLEIDWQGQSAKVQDPPIEAVMKIRSREAGGEWSRWFPFRSTYGRPVVFWAGYGMSGLIGSDARRWQFEWRLQGTIDGAGAIDAAYHLTLSD